MSSQQQGPNPGVPFTSQAGPNQGQHPSMPSQMDPMYSSQSRYGQQGPVPPYPGTPGQMEYGKQPQNYPNTSSQSGYPGNKPPIDQQFPGYMPGQQGQFQGGQPGQFQGQQGQYPGQPGQFAGQRPMSGQPGPMGGNMPPSGMYGTPNKRFEGYMGPGM